MVFDDEEEGGMKRRGDEEGEELSSWRNTDSARDSSSLSKR
jgi:hypothetical protein